MRGRETFRTTIAELLSEFDADPKRDDNPVWDFLLASARPKRDDSVEERLSALEARLASGAETTETWSQTVDQSLVERLPQGHHGRTFSGGCYDSPRLPEIDSQ